MNDYKAAVTQAGIGGTPQLCQDALIELLTELFRGKKYTGQESQKELHIYKQALSVPRRQKDRRADTNEAAAPYILVEMTEGAIPDADSAQLVEFNIIICVYDDGLHRQAATDVANIKEDIIQQLCSRPYFGGAFTVLYPISWAFQQDDTDPYYFGAVSITCSAPAITRDSDMEPFI